MTLSGLIAAQRDHIIQCWGAQVKKEAGAEATRLSRPELVDNIPGLLDEIVVALRRDTPLAEESPNAVEHGKQRLRVGFDLATVVLEYGILRNCILDEAQEQGVALATREVRVLADCLNTGIGDAVTEYAGSRRRLLEMFVGVLGHDLKNPLNAISTGASTLMSQAGGTPDVVVRVCSRIASSAERMNRLVDQMLDFSRAGLGGGFSLHRRWADLHELAARIVEELQIANPEHLIELRSGGVYTGWWDTDRIAQVLSNLIGNALRYGSPKTPVTVILTGRAEELTLSVHNLGNPIPEQSLRSIFDPFSRGDESAGQGIGLGLYIVREIVREHDGTVEVESSAAEGTLFRVRLPRRAT